MQGALPQEGSALGRRMRLVAASEQPRSRLCMACFDGTYPIPLPDIVGKHVLEGIERGADRVEHAAGYAAEDALSRP